MASAGSDRPNYDVNIVYPESYHRTGAEDRMRPAWKAIADGLESTFPEAQYHSWLDVGCGPGMLVREMRDRGYAAHGIDGSASALNVIPELDGWLWCFDLREPVQLHSLYDVVVCSDVAEHVGAAHTLVASCVRHAKKAIIFGAAPPGQDGHGHIDLRPKEEWHAMFAALGWLVDADTTVALKATIAAVEAHNRVWWFEANVNVYRRQA